MLYIQYFRLKEVSKTKNFIFKGKQSFSSSKLDQIKHQFSNSNKIDAKISSNEIYLVQSKSETINHEGLQDILAARENDVEFTFYVGPRLGTISPWSSKTAVSYTHLRAHET